MLAGGIRDDGPLPEVVADVVQAQKVRRGYAQQTGACLMLSTMLHSIAVGDMPPAGVRTVCADIDPVVVTKLGDRGSFRTVGVVTDVGLFVEQLAAVELKPALGFMLLPGAFWACWTGLVFQTERPGALPFVGNQSPDGAISRLFGCGSGSQTLWLVAAGATLRLAGRSDGRRLTRAARVGSLG